MVTVKTIYEKAKDLKNSVEKEYKLTESYKNHTYLICKTIITPNTIIPSKIGVKAPTKPVGNSISRQIPKNDYIKLAKSLVSYVDRKGRLPDYLPWNGYKIHPKVYCYMFARICVYYYSHSRTYPKYVNVNSKAFVKPTEPYEEVFNYFVKVFGSVSTIDGALSKIQGNGYGYYYDDVYSNKTSIDRMRDGDGVNCTDSCHVFYNIAKKLGYEVHCIHVQCRGGDGHVRLKLRHKTHTENEWIYRDPASVLSGNDVTSNWCSDGYLLDIDPSWFMENLNR